ISPNFKSGKTVSKNELLFSIDPFRSEKDVSDAKLALATSQQQIEELQLQILNEQSSQFERQQELEIANEDLSRQIKLKEQNFVSDAAVERARISVSSAERVISGSERSIKLLQAKAEQLKTAKQRAELNLARVNRNLETTEFRAPFEGLVSNANLQLGRVVGTSEALATLIDLSALEVSFRIPDRDIGQMLQSDDNKNTTGVDGILNRKTDVRWSLGTNVLSFAGHISRIGANVNASLGGLEVFARLDNLNSNTPLRPGAYVEVNVNAGLEKNVFALPQAAVSPSGQLYFVGEDTRVEIINVKVIRREGDNVLVRGDVPTDKEIIVRRFPQISKGVKVKLSKSRTENGQSNGQSNGQNNAAPVEVTLSQETQDMILARIKNIPIPAKRKKQMQDNIKSGSMLRSRLERMAERMGLDIPELSNQPAQQSEKPSGDALPASNPDELVLSSATQALLLERVKASPISPDRKQQIINTISSGKIKRSRLERMVERMGIDVPELAN
ncbi:MAG: efflux RND transporter periplasmic adaptor subunit, partial [Alphaproteobacteria bacterium]